MIVGSLRRNLSQHPEYLKALTAQFANAKRLPTILPPLSIEESL